ncbi:hypothetical protein SAMN05192559_106248 [Halobacillus karajensis]|uniref:Uncharacterized protein n=1 Tax=Halobacillus karajensis TaxID=195088 RepID=A0A024P763_9BACI|nr:hypothetical protein [Halobacillus karajensis]CDQ20952.1 hypothetical protein BN982_03312 [Halobacillus karajensis]CDQ24984.1 hypothetical protein BN983_03285 [Halobacillus karajensis]CDQ28655.1 hypothetical protein BN981_02967 [Halobacillus karajensis]SEH98157.1 hypothetical protein SAMN05192559_106248 [Halobacillus karajensis]
MIISVYPPENSYQDRYVLIDQLRELGYTEDAFGKRTIEMTLPELQQITINLEYKKECAWRVE